MIYFRLPDLSPQELVAGVAGFVIGYAIGGWLLGLF